MKAPCKPFISCGMYAFTDSLRSAWQALFDEFLAIHESPLEVESKIRFDVDFDQLRNPNLLLGHTCGYPLMRFLRDDCQPFCVPLFDVDGCDGKYYSSHLIVPADSDIITLSECQNKIVGLNGYDSNSGMNVLRHAVSRLNPPPVFFSKAIETGSHFNSLVAVANDQADIAAIDCVSFALIKDEWPDLVNKVRSIEFSERTCGLPFVVPDSGFNSDKKEQLLHALTLALSRLAEPDRNRLHLIGFEAVMPEDFQSIIDLENNATKAGYPELI